MLTLTDIEAAMDKARAGRDAARAEAERNTQLFAAYSNQLQALMELMRVTHALVLLEPPALPPVPPLPPMPIAPEPRATGWKCRARTTTPEPGSASRAGEVLAWLRANWREEGHTNSEIATGVRSANTRGWFVTNQLSVLYDIGLLQRRELVPRQPGGKYAYRARPMDREPTPG